MSGLNNFGTTVPPHLFFTSVGKYYISKNSAVNDKHQSVIERIHADSTPAATIFNSDTQIVYNYPRTIHQLEESILELNINDTHAVAATTAVWSCEGFNVAAGVLAAVATGDGIYQIGFPLLGVKTVPLLFSTALADVQIAIRATHPALASVTVGGALMTAPGVMTITMTHTTGEFPLEGMGVEITGGFTAGFYKCWNSTAYATGGSLKLAPGPILLKEVELLANGKVAEQYDGAHLWFHSVTHRREEETKELGYNIGYDFDRNVSTNFIDGASGSLTIRIPLAGILHDQGTIMPALFPDIKWTLRITFQGHDSILDTTSGATATRANLSLASSYLWIAHRKYDADQWAQIKSNVGSYADFRQYEFIDRVVDNKTTLVAGTEYTTKIASPGHMSEMFFVVRPSTKTAGSSWTSPLKLNQIVVEDHSGNDLLGDDNVTHRMMRDIIMPNRFPKIKRNILTNFNFYTWCPSSDPVTAKMEGQLLGLYQMDGTEIVKWTPTDASAVATELVVYYTNLRTMRVFSNGDVKYL